MQHQELTYDRFLYLMESYKSSYYSLMYANMLLTTHLNSNKKECSYPKNYLSVVDVNNINLDDSLYLLKDNFIAEMKQWSQSYNVDYNTALYKRSIANSHFIRMKVLNSFYEIIKKFLDKFDKDEIYIFHSYDWFRMLYILRNAGSHEDNLNSRIYFPSRPKIPKYPSVIQWKTLKVTEHQIEIINYNDREVLELISYSIDFFRQTPKYHIQT